MNSIRLRLTRKLLATLVLLLGGGLVAIYLLMRAALIAEFDHSLTTKALAVASQTEQMPGQTIAVEFTDRFMRGFGDEAGTDFFELWAPDGSVIRRSPALHDSDLPQTAAPYAKPFFWSLTLPKGLHARAIGYEFNARLNPKVAKATPRMRLRLVVASGRKALDETLGQLKMILCGCGLLALGATTALVRGLLASELRPLERLGEQATRITADSLAMRFPTDDLPAELLPIASRLNELLARLQESFEREHRFSADLSHELRTPLAELLSLSECAIKWPEDRSPATDEEILAIARHMEGLVSRMLILARSERGQLPLRREEIQVGPLIEAIWKPLGERAAAKRLRVTFAGPPAIVTADPVLVRSILWNLFDNAVEYTPMDGQISTSVAQVPSGVSISVANTTVGFTEADRRSLFDRFWRKEASRTGTEHAGLGLSVARQFARAMEMELAADLVGDRLIVTLSGGRGSLSAVSPVDLAAAGR